MPKRRWCIFCLRDRLSQAKLASHAVSYCSWAFQLLKNISRFAQSSVSSNLWSYRAFPQKVRRGMSWLCFPSAWPSSQSSHQYFPFNLHIQVGFCLIARSQNYTNLPDSWICGRLRVFADFCGRFAGNFGRSYVHLYALVLGI